MKELQRNKAKISKCCQTLLRGRFWKVSVCDLSLLLWSFSFSYSYSYS